MEQSGEEALEEALKAASILTTSATRPTTTRRTTTTTTEPTTSFYKLEFSEFDGFDSFVDLVCFPISHSVEFNAYRFMRIEFNAYRI